MPQSSKENLFTILLLILLGMGVYFNSLDGQFLWDDNHFIKNNAIIKDFVYLPKIFTESMGSGSYGQSFYYRPIQELTYMVDYHLWKWDVRGYHLTNILIHVLTAISVYILILTLSGNQKIASLASLLFVIHPIHSEAVNALAGRGEPLTALFMLISIIFYIKNVDSTASCATGETRGPGDAVLARGVGLGHVPRASGGPNGRPLTHNLNFWGILLSYLLALLTKENTVVLPLLLLAYHFCYRKHITIKHILPIVIALFLYALIRIFVAHSMSSIQQQIVGGWSRLPSFFAAFVQYWRLLILPFDLHFDYGQKVYPWNDGMAILGATTFVLLAIYGIYRRKDNALISFSISWFLLTLLPYTNFYLLYSYMAEHYLYFPSVGFFIMVTNIIYAFQKNNFYLFLSRALITILLMFYGALTIHQNHYWHDPFTFYARTIHYSPQNWILYNNLGNEYAKIGDKANEIKSYQKSIELNPNYALAYRNLGVTYLDLEKLPEAEASLKKSLELDSAVVETYNVLGVVYKKMGKIRESIELFENSIRINPDYTRGYCNLGAVYFETKEYEKAMAYLQKAIETDRNNPDAYYNLGLTYFVLGRKEEARKLFQKTIQINPSHQKAKFHLGIIDQKISIK